MKIFGYLLLSGIAFGQEPPPEGDVRVSASAEDCCRGAVGILPGVSLVGTEKTPGAAREFVRALRHRPATLPQALDTLVASLNLTVQLNDSSLLAAAKSFGTDVFTGRGRKGSWLAVGTIAAMGFAMLAALSGKALMASIAALTMSAMRAAGGGGNGGGNGGAPPPPPPPAAAKIQYEIVRAPPYEHHHDHSYLPYSYAKRNIDADPQLRH